MSRTRFLLALAFLASVPAVHLAGQSSAGAKPSPSAAIPRTPDGRPDLGGMWTNVTITRLERPAEFGTKLTVSDAEATAYEKAYLKNNDKDRRDGGSRADVERAYNAFF